MRLALVAALLMLSACGQDEPKAPTVTSTPVPGAPAVAMPDSPPLENGATLRLRAVDLEGNPVPGMVPIVTRNANATDYPLASGAPSGADGSSTLTVPVLEHVYVRMWDPTFGRFANNYFDVQVGKDVPDEVLEVVMVPGASITAMLTDAAQRPAAGENVGLMMFHPLKGAWWPAEAASDSQGVVRFPHVPAGKYTIRIKALTSGEIELKDVMLQPGAAVDLGVLRLTAR